MVMKTSNHWPCLIEINTKIRKGTIFRFENHWLSRDDFVTVLIQGWSAPYLPLDPAKAINAKCKNFTKMLKIWKNRSPPLVKTIANVKMILQLIDTMECFSDLTISEWNFREILCSKLVSLLKQQRSYWKQRGKINWVKEGDASTKYFHAHATIKHRKNTIACLQDESANGVIDHDEKAKLMWETFKDRLGRSEYNGMLYNLNNILPTSEMLNELEAPFSKQEIDEVVSQLPNNKSPGQMASIMSLSRDAGLLLHQIIINFFNHYLKETFA